MKIVSTSYANTAEFKDPVAWLQRIDFYTGILEELAKKYSVESIEQINYSGVLEHKGVAYHFLDFKKPVIYFPHRLHRHIKELKPDIVFVNGIIFPLQLLQLRWKLGGGVKIILLHRGEKPYTGLKKYLQMLADRYVHAYLFTSAGFGAQWTVNGNISDQRKIHEVIQASSVFTAAENNAAVKEVDGDPVFLWVGRLDANKDPLTVVKAFVEFLSFQPNASLYMIYQEDELLSEVKKLIISNSNAVKLIGKVPHRDLQDWYNSVRFIISGSHHEGSGIAVCEAMSCGCIPLLTDIVSFRKMTGPGACGLLYEPGNTAALLKVLVQSMRMDIQAERKRTLTQFKNELSFEAIAKKIGTVIEAV